LVELSYKKQIAVSFTKIVYVKITVVICFIAFMVLFLVQQYMHGI